MKAPDKIYLYGDSVHNEPTRDWGIEPKTGSYRGRPILSKEYIQKDTLLEWAGEWHERYPYSHEFQMIIDKLKSM